VEIMFIQDLQICLNFINNNLRTLIFLETFIELCIIDYVTLRIMFSSFFCKYSECLLDCMEQYEAHSQLRMYNIN